MSLHRRFRGAVSAVWRPVLIVVGAIAVLLLSAGPAMATSGSGSSTSGGTVSPLVWYGQHCQNVKSPNGPTHGSICIILNVSDVTGSIQALVRFNSASGNLAWVTDTNLALNGAGLSNPVRDNGYQFEYVTSSTNDFFSTSWYNFPPYTYWYSDVENPCMVWPTGRQACVSGWLQSTLVYYGW